MEIIGDRKFVKVPGGDVHELPPLIIGPTLSEYAKDRAMTAAESMVTKDIIVPDFPLDVESWSNEALARRVDMAVNLLVQYQRIASHWQWGNDIFQWIRQCETTFEERPNLKPLLKPDVWPHAGRSSFVTLLQDKAVTAGEGVNLEKAVGLRLTFRRRPQLDLFTDQFLFYLDTTVAHSAYHAWANMNSEPVHDLPPERFQVNVLKM